MRSGGTICAALGLLGLGAAALTGCADDATEVLSVCGDLRAPLEIDAVRVSVLDAQQEGETFTGVVELLECDPERLTQLPIEVDIPRIGDVAWVRVQGLSGGVEIVRAELRAGPAGERGPLRLNLSSRCLGQTCSLGQTCYDGACVIAPDAGDPRLRCDAPELVADDDNGTPDDNATPDDNGTAPGWCARLDPEVP